jgi:hypothetical protein
MRIFLKGLPHLPPLNWVRIYLRPVLKWVKSVKKGREDKRDINERKGAPKCA